MSNDDETVERVARAIAALRLRGGGVSFDDPQVAEYFRQGIYDEARAALSALPPRELLREALDALEIIGNHPTGGVGCNPQSFVEIARAAADKIRASLT